MPVVLQSGADGIGHGADAHLQAGAVRNEFGAASADFHVHPGRAGIGAGDERALVPDQGGETLQGNKVSVSERHLRVHHGDALPGHFQRGRRAIYRRSQRDHAVHRFGYLHHGHVARKRPRAVHQLGFEKVGGDIVGNALLHGRAEVGPHEKALVPEGAPMLRRSVRGGTFGVEMVEMYVGEFPGALAQGFDKDLRNAGDAGEVDMVSAPHPLHGFPGADVR